MASPEINKIRERFGMDTQPPHLVDQPVDPITPAELYMSAVATIHNRAELGEISTEEAYDLVHSLDTERAGFGDSWYDRYGETPEELR